ncbi:MAG: fluoride efflux transporter CrcB [Gammaproteobacteria bacterium]|nr:fluoride efflux transporter CrcB [Gammaproteobacteria bacterium]
MWQNLVAIALGGAIGSVLRYAVNLGFARHGGQFPWATFSVNAAGSFLFGVLAFVLLEKLPEAHTLRAFALVGVLGAFTTFSTFSYETLGLLQAGDFVRAAGNAIGSVIVCVLAAWGGLALARHVF